ncbi:hypothetical protein Arub01_25930 [Actinomadura rubrobrunea]|uniref:DUF1877 family protein n=1 Tax=Actinomadura rubrobrunea TaxID=115335 RepID=A0A9W6PTQ8_9ACTN|nr:hypothetical protein [Actinomadura rubrobrunea]GLW64349.1 hypothetical protein Arub01_25930 [Actinomadura rubrobrunea]
MGVLVDYFRATDSETVVRALERTDGHSPVGGEHSIFDGVETKNVDPPIALGTLIAAIRRVPWHGDLVHETPVWPTSPGPDGPQFDDDWPGPWVLHLDVGVRDTLAGVRDADIPRLAAEWAQAEELDQANPEDLRPLIEELVQLARNARDAGEQLYCWCCV